MSKGRDYVAEIVSKRSRLLSETDRFKQLSARSGFVWESMEFLKNEAPDDAPHKVELLKYLPIGFVACIEGYFRLLYRDLIDHGPPFSDNVSGFKDIKFGVEQVVAIHSKKTVSLGEFVSHLLPANNLGDINRNMTTLIGEEFLERLARTRIALREDFQPSLKEHNLHPEIFQTLKRLFELRHIFCHELAPAVQIDAREAEDCANAAMILLITTEAMSKELMPAST
jgi:hypothetical protein